MTEWLRDGLDGRSLKAILCLYIFGLIVLTPVVALVGLLFGTQTAFQVTPLLVVILGGIEYSICYLYPLLRDRNEACFKFSQKLVDKVFAPLNSLFRKW